MKRIRCPKCDNYLVFDETRYTEGQTLVFECPECRKQFGIRIGTSTLLATRKDEKKNANSQQLTPTPSSSSSSEPLGSVIVVENVFHFRQTIPLQMGDNVFGRYVKGTLINCPIETVDPSIDTTHCIINVQRNKQGKIVYTLRDAPSNTGTFVGNTILRDQDRLRISNETIITIGATTLILSLPDV